MVDPDLGLLQGVPIFAGLSDAQLELLAASLQQRSYPPRTIVFHQDEPGHALFIIVSGAVRVFVTSDTGQEMTVDILSRGEVFGEMALFGLHPRSASVTTLSPTHTLLLLREDFHRFLREMPEIGIHVLQVLSDRLRATTAFAAEMAFNDLHGRTARVLLTLAERHGKPGTQGIELDVDLTQSDLAALVGTTRESMNRILGAFRDQGLVRLSGARIALLRPADLRRITARRPTALEV
jgi:CRP/FNR family transcriptional regulator